MTVTGVDLDGADATNYTVSQPSGLTADITAKNLTIDGAVADNKTYDGTTTATVDFTGATLNGVESGDTVTLDDTGYAATFDGPGGKNVGDDKPVTVTGVDIGGTDATNYTVSQPSGLTANITQLDTTGELRGGRQDLRRHGRCDDVLAHGRRTRSRATTWISTGDATFDGRADVGRGQDGDDLEREPDRGRTPPNYNLTGVGTDTADITAKNLTISGAVGEQQAVRRRRRRDGGLHRRRR